MNQPLIAHPQSCQVQPVLKAAKHVGILAPEEGGRYHKLYGRWDLTYSLISTTEEVLEMAGLVILLRTLLEYLADQYRELQVRFLHGGITIADPPTPPG